MPVIVVELESQMDRRSWLWRRKSSSSDKIPAETDSSGSISSLSERFSDDQLQAYAIHNPQLPESTQEEPHYIAKTLTDKLSAALLNLSAKEELAKQHAKVAEEAVSGWENAEKEVLALKKQLEDAIKKNSGLKDRVGHLDGALKECVRQLQQAREEQEQMIKEALAKKNSEWESTKFELETQLVELRAQSQHVRNEAAVSVDSDFLQKLEAAEKENSSLKFELLSQAKLIEIKILESDLTTQAAETACKLHLESIKKVAELEAECRRLKSIARKASFANDHKSLTASSIYVEPFTDNQSDNGERLLAVEEDACKLGGLDQCDPSCSDSMASALVAGHDRFKDQMAIGRNHMVLSREINLMDDFLEMERLAALPDTESRNSYLQTGPLSDQLYINPWKAEFKSLIHRTAELEEKLERIQEEKVKSETTLTECQSQVDLLQSQLKESDAKILELQAHLTTANHSNQAREEQIKGVEAKREVIESQLRIAEAEIKTLLSEVASLNIEIKKERILSVEIISKCQKLEDELSKLKHEAELEQEAELRRVASFNGEMKTQQEKELAVASRKFAECQKTISSIGLQLKSLATWEDLLFDSENAVCLLSEGVQYLANGGEQRELHSGDSYSGQSLPK